MSRPRGERVFGLHAVTRLLKTQPERVRACWLQAGRDDARMRALRALLQEWGVPTHVAPRAELEELAGGGRHQGVVAEVVRTRLPGEQALLAHVAELEGPPLLLVLDRVQDPHNLGACLRTADAAGVDAVVIPRDHAARLTPAARKVASGAAETVPLFAVGNLARTLRALREAGLWIYGATGDAAQDLYETDLRGPAALVLGGEGGGLRRLTRQHCDFLVRIPMAGTVESLNVSVAAGVLLYEAWRQRRR